MKAKAKSPRRLQPTRAQANGLPKPIVDGHPTRVYLAVSVPMFGSAVHGLARELVRERFPDLELLDAADMFSSSADWRRRWPRIVLTLDRLVFIADEDGIIGAGVFQEILDARFRGVPVEHVASAGRFVPVDNVVFRMLGGDQASHFARVRVSRSR